VKPGFPSRIEILFSKILFSFQKFRISFSAAGDAIHSESSWNMSEGFT